MLTKKMLDNSIKANVMGNLKHVTIESLSPQQIIALLGFYNSECEVPAIKFSDLLLLCVVGKHENSELTFIYLNESGSKCYKTICHGFYNLYEHEEEQIVKHLIKTLKLETEE